MFCFPSPASRYKHLRRDVLFRRREDDSRDEGRKKVSKKEGKGMKRDSGKQERRGGRRRMGGGLSTGERVNVGG